MNKVEVTPERLERALEILAREEAQGKTRITLSTAGEVLKAVEMGVINKSEARLIFGFKKRRAPRRPKV